ncbi:MAG: hypothetical protein AAF927_05985 [Bacteroidota bacterium]
MKKSILIISVICALSFTISCRQAGKQAAKVVLPKITKFLRAKPMVFGGKISKKLFGSKSVKEASNYVSSHTNYQLQYVQAGKLAQYSGDVGKVLSEISYHFDDVIQTVSHSASLKVLKEDRSIRAHVLKYIKGIKLKDVRYAVDLNGNVEFIIPKGRGELKGCVNLFKMIRQTAVYAGGIGGAYLAGASQDEEEEQILEDLEEINEILENDRISEVGPVFTRFKNDSFEKDASEENKVPSDWQANLDLGWKRLPDIHDHDSEIAEVEIESSYGEKCVGLLAHPQGKVEYIAQELTQSLKPKQYYRIEFSACYSENYLYQIDNQHVKTDYGHPLGLYLLGLRKDNGQVDILTQSPSVDRKEWGKYTFFFQAQTEYVALAFSPFFPDVKWGYGNVLIDKISPVFLAEGVEVISL